ncbi:hypothetical protein HDR63_02365 [bacterium]|nr:hypothetical protein [bacterium]
MKKLLPVLGIVVVIAAGVVAVVLNRRVPAHLTSAAAYEMVSQAIGGQLVMTVGPTGDFLVRVPATAALKKIAAGEKTAKFLSVENPAQYVQDGTVLINVIPNNVRTGGCPYRLATAVTAQGYYAVELCHE